MGGSHHERIAQTKGFDQRSEKTEHRRPFRRMAEIDMTTERRADSERRADERRQEERRKAEAEKLEAERRSDARRANKRCTGPRREK